MSLFTDVLRSAVTDFFNLTRSLLSDRRFVTATLILALVAGGWGVAVEQLQVYFMHYRVKWVVGTTVDDGFRNTSFPQRIDRFERVNTYGVLDKSKARTDGPPDGERVIPADTLELLGMGTDMDKAFIADQASNWYVSRIYQDSAESSPRSPYRLWLLDVTYYTGGIDTVAHIGENCLVAGGATMAGSEPFTVDVPDAPEGWKKVAFQRLLYSRDDHQYVQYYIFSLNGAPENSREAVRLGQIDPFRKYCYFAKIQLAPAAAVDDLAQADARTTEFIQKCLPAVLKQLPSAAALNTLESARKSPK